LRFVLLSVNDVTPVQAAYVYALRPISDSNVLYLINGLKT